MLAEYEIDEMLTLFSKDATPRLHEAAQALDRLRDWANARSDGWMYWRKPSQASARLQERLKLADDARRRNGAVDDITTDEWSRLFRPIRQFLSDQKVEDPDMVLFPPPPPAPKVYRNPLMEILSAVETEPKTWWELAKERPDDYRDWQSEVVNGDTLLSFVDWLNTRDEAPEEGA